MARSNSKKWFDVGIPLDSLTYQCLLEDCRESGSSIGQLIALRCADWYKMTRSGMMIQQAMQPAASTPGQDDDEPANNMSANADAALDEWS
jgi:hypothetical protein